MNKNQIETLGKEEAQKILDQLYQNVLYAEDADGSVHIYEIASDGLGEKIAEL